MLSPIELETGRQAEPVYQIVYECLTFLEGDKYVMVNAVLPLIILCHQKLIGMGGKFKVPTEDRKGVVKMKLSAMQEPVQLLAKIMAEQLKKRFLTEPPHWTTTVVLYLDPFIDHELLMQYQHFTGAHGIDIRATVEHHLSQMAVLETVPAAPPAAPPPAPPAPAEYIGRKVRAKFGVHGIFSGVVSETYLQNGRTYFKTRFVDGDVHDYTLPQLERVIVPWTGATAAAMGGSASDDSESESDDSDDSASAGSALLAMQARKAYRASGRAPIATPAERSRSEMETYRAIAVGAANSALESPLVFWSQYEFQLPRHYKLARRVFAILATEANCERFFSKAGSVLTAKRMLLDPEVAAATSVFGLECDLFAITDAQFNAILDE